LIDMVGFTMHKQKTCAQHKLVHFVGPNQIWTVHILLF
jgi:hypothetical protein